MAYDQIPDELKQLPQWVCWGKDKVPYDPKTGGYASVIDKATWTTFDDSVKVCGRDQYNGIGFVFTDADDYSLIDLDDTKGDQVALNRQVEICREFDSYSEVSPSGHGLHIIIRGNVPAGRRRSYVEIYSSRRYATFTGNVYNNKPIRNCQEKLIQLWHQMGNGQVVNGVEYHVEQEEKYTDAQIIEQARNAANGNKFSGLFAGNWQKDYPSQSEADFAIINIIAFYTKNRKQIERIFWSSALGARSKAKRQDYLAWMINKSFDRDLPPIDFDKNILDLKSAITKPNGKDHDPIIPAASTIPLPPGLLGELAQFIYAAAPRPVPEIALAGAIGLMAGICGKAYNISRTGLNQYVLLLAKTGRGKEAIASGIDRLMNAVRLTVPTSSRFRGPAIINSGAALVKHISNTSNCFVSVLGEFGLTIDRVSSPFANYADRMLYQMLLDLYNKSGHGQTLQSSIYSRKEDNTNIVESPSVTILGESNPKIFYDILNEGMIAAGLLPRFLIIEYDGIRVPTNDGHEIVEPSFNLIDKLGSLIANVEGTLANKRIINVKYEDKALVMLKDFDHYADAKINLAKDDVVEELWNRGHMKALRLSALIAVGVNMIEPVITVAHAEWALNLIRTDIKTLSSKFDAGEVGANTLEIKQINETVRIIKEFVTKDWDHVSKYIKTKNMHTEKVIPYLYLNKRLANNVSFKSDKIGATSAMKRSIQTLIDRDTIREMSKQDAHNRFGTSQKCYVVSDTDIV